MHVLVLGAGVIGLTTAYTLAREGHEVTLLDAEPAVARGASAANGGQLSYSYVAPFAGPGVPWKVPGWLMDPDGPLRFRPELDPHQWGWIWRFLRACNATTAAETTARLLRLAYLSRELTQEVAARGVAEFGFAHAGKLVLQPDAAAMEGAKRQMELQARLGSEQVALDRDACVALEPSLARIAHRIAGGIHTPGEDAGDCALFCEGLAAWLARSNHKVAIRLGLRARQIIRAEGRIRGVATDAGVIEADALVVCLGLGARELLRPLGQKVPIYPLKGYSLTLPVARDDAAPRVSVTDSASKVVYARLGGYLRVAGMADLVGVDPRLHEGRLSTLIRQAREAFPEAGNWDGPLRPWTGLRPYTPTGLPLIGRSPAAPNLYLNTGHGGLGWTLAMGSAAVLAAHLAGRAPPIPTDGFDPGTA
ncbi:MAG TPA: D-amino acid dehydrogenase [Roseococcus sp.]|jgi:D-amino-acid dehydrogenase|nr:D-amino acid dehydrogenase [Roseococcus sp.]